MSTPTKAECLDRFWDTVVLAHANLCRRRAAKAARQAAETPAK